MHEEKKIVHRDLKPENILLERPKDLNDLKLIDFGTAKKFEESNTLIEKVGTSYYMAPEVIKVQSKGSNTDPNTYYNERCDIWSIGVIAYMLCTGKQPFELKLGEKDQDIYRKISVFKHENAFEKDGIFGIDEFKHLNDDTKSFIQQCLNPKFREGKCPYAAEDEKEYKKFKTWDSEGDDDVRISAKTGLEHQWITKVAENLIMDLKGEKRANAKKNLNAFKDFRPFREVPGDDPHRMKEAVLSIIGCKLLSEDQYQMIKDIFRIMDKSGDGSLQTDEIKFGFDSLMTDPEDNKNEWTDDEINQMIDYVKPDCEAEGGKKQIEFKDFLVASIRTNASFIGYMDKAYKLFFDNDEESIETNELIDQLCGEKIIKPELLKQVAENIDEDKSQTITAFEFFKFVIENLGLKTNQQYQKDWDAMLVKKLLEKSHPNIGLSGTFLGREVIIN